MMATHAQKNCCQHSSLSEILIILKVARCCRSSRLFFLFQTFIMNNPTQTEQLLSAILEHSSVSMLSVPFFSPNDNPESFTTMYRRILESADGDLVFSLLTKVTEFTHLTFVKLDTSYPLRLMMVHLFRPTKLNMNSPVAVFRFHFTQTHFCS